MPDYGAGTVIPSSARTRLGSNGMTEISRPLPYAPALYELTDRLFRARSRAEIYQAALDAILNGLHCARASILIFDDDGVMRFVASRGISAGYRAAVEGHTPWKPGERDASAIFVRDIDRTEEPESLKAVVKGEGIRALAFIPLTIDGAVVGKFMTYYATPRAFHDDETALAVTIARQVGFALDRVRTEEIRLAALATRQRLASIIESSDDAIISKDLNGIVVSWNAGAERLFGYTAEEMIGKPILILIPEDHRDEEPRILDQIRRGEPIDHYETIRRRKDGTLIHISLVVSPVKDAAGRIIGASKIARDITERRRAEEQKNLLINELNHRVKNTLATVQSLASEDGSDARDRFNARLSALSNAHDVLTSESWAGASIREIVSRATGAFRSQERLRIAGPHVRVAPKQALALSMALHELSTNAAKYGALSNDKGHIDIEWRTGNRNGSRVAELTWVEAGGPPVSPPAHKGFGSRMIEGHHANELGGEVSIEFREEGVVCRIATPLVDHEIAFPLAGER
jgi:PAS domain S-box-containing protein